MGVDRDGGFYAIVMRSNLHACVLGNARCQDFFLNPSVVLCEHRGGIGPPVASAFCAQGATSERRELALLHEALIRFDCHAGVCIRLNARLLPQLLVIFVHLLRRLTPHIAENALTLLPKDQVLLQVRAGL